MKAFRQYALPFVAGSLFIGLMNAPVLASGSPWEEVRAQISQLFGITSDLQDQISDLALAPDPGVTGYEVKEIGQLLDPSSSVVLTIQCASGKKVISAGHFMGGGFMRLAFSHPDPDGSRWNFGVINGAGDSFATAVRAYAICVDAS